jgi:hypothetical protein
MDAHPSWSFERYQAYEQTRFQQSLGEQEQARSGGWSPTPSRILTGAIASPACGPTW